MLSKKASVCGKTDVLIITYENILDFIKEVLNNKRIDEIVSC